MRFTFFKAAITATTITAGLQSFDWYKRSPTNKDELTILETFSSLFGQAGSAILATCTDTLNVENFAGALYGTTLYIECDFILRDNDVSPSLAIPIAYTLTTAICAFTYALSQMIRIEDNPAHTLRPNH